MTTNQTIDGVLVPRELLSYWAECLESAGFKDRPAEMRSLLDADKVNNRQMGLMQFVEAHPIKSAARREPIAWYTEDYLTDRSATTYDLATMERWKAKGWPVSPLYIDLPAPVAVALPERLTQAELEELEVIEAFIHGQGLSNLAGTMAAARQFIDEVTRLNAKSR